MMASEFENCFCDKFSQLEGKAADAYISQFLEILGSEEDDNQVYYCCRACGQSWIKAESEKRPVSLLVKQKTEHDV